MSFQNTYTTYTIEAFPHGERTVVATLHGIPANREGTDLAYAALRAGVSVGSEVEGIVRHAQTQAKVRGEYVDVYRERPVQGSKVLTQRDHIATVGPEGVI